MQLVGIILMLLGAAGFVLYGPRTRESLSETRAIAVLSGAFILFVAGLYLSIAPNA